MTKDAGATIEKKFKCKLCGKTFERGTGLGSHMRSTHGIAGMAKSTVVARARANVEAPKPARGAPQSPIQQNLGGPTKCPECGIVCANKAAAANHRRAAHGVKSKAQLYRERLAERKLPTAEIILSTPATEEKSIEKRKPEADNTHPQIDSLLFAFAVGQIKEQCRHIAEEHDVPTKLFTRQFAELFLREARR